ncbi:MULTISPECIES: SAM-dependent methyltransferase [Pseudonocardia]|uniref:SAM-dependent methyltransferase n=1 Tax=Pseudonocardia TaxID=1847 RepID=UPI001AD6191C|nr:MULTISPECIES: SAM-dependent methyltransferase [Pseudonocardia]MBO4238551.1 SAM-dependent methyltransferase [Pseudonocardia alni]
MRTADDQWDITSSVGATALAVAAGRALETRRADRLVDDPYAQRFVDAAGTLSAAPRDPDDAADPWVVQAGYQGVRSRFFDEALTGAGTTQVVLLAAGLDARALRLPWPAGTTVFEVDQPKVLDFKDGVVAGAGITPTARRVTVPVDLRHDWPAALTAAGFDPDRPTAWLAEGLLPYLPADAERLLFERVHALSVPGSRIAVEHFGDQVERIADDPSFREAAQEMLHTTDVRELFFAEPRAESCDDWLRRHGWTVTARPVREVAAGYGRPLHDTVTDTLGSATLLWADRP